MSRLPTSREVEDWLKDRGYEYEPISGLYFEGVDDLTRRDLVDLLSYIGLGSLNAIVYLVEQRSKVYNGRG